MENFFKITKFTWIGLSSFAFLVVTYIVAIDIHCYTPRAGKFGALPIAATSLIFVPIYWLLTKRFVKNIILCVEHYTETPQPDLNQQLQKIMWIFLAYFALITLDSVFYEVFFVSSYRQFIQEYLCF